MLLTVGHGTHPAEEFARLLQQAGVAALVDIRVWPASRRNPQFERSSLQAWLPQAGVDYRWERRLGGYRRLPEESPDTALRNASFRAYAGHMRTPEFGAAVADLLAQAADRQSAVMCSESVWWRCHRRLVADAVVLLHGRQVRHLMPDGRIADHRPTEGVRVAGDELYYDLAAG